MDLNKIFPKDDLYVEDGCWKFRLRCGEKKPENIGPGTLPEQKQDRDLIWIGTAIGHKGLTRREALAILRTAVPSRVHTEGEHSAMTVAEFVERRFVPEYVASKSLSGRIYYQSILKHVIDPGLVDRAFGSDSAIKKARLRYVPGWPYLDDVLLRDVRPDSVKNLLLAALKEGYSMQTVSHIRNVVCTIFGIAEKEMHFSGENPTRLIKVQKIDPAPSRAPTHAEVVRLMSVMRYPEKEMTLIAILTGITFSEICGLRWKRVNLTADQVLNPDGETIPPKTIMVREELVRGQVVQVREKRQLNHTIPNLLMSVIRRLNSRATGNPDEFVLVSETGRPINLANIVSCRLKRLGKELAIPSLSSQNVCQIHKSLVGEFGSSFPDQITGLVDAARAQSCVYE